MNNRVMVNYDKYMNIPAIERFEELEASFERKTISKKKQKVSKNAFAINSMRKNKIRDNRSRFLKALQKNRRADLRVETSSELEVSMRSFNSDGASFCHDVGLFAPYNSPIFFYGKKVIEQKFIGKRSLTKSFKRYDLGLADPYRSESEMISEGINDYYDQIDLERERQKEELFESLQEDELFFCAEDYDWYDEMEDYEKMANGRTFQPVSSDEGFTEEDELYFLACDY